VSIHLHLIEGEQGCRFARENNYAAVVVDALRASATAAMMFHAGAKEIFVVREVEDAFVLRRENPSLLLYGEREGLPPYGFDGGNSPREVSRVRNQSVAFTTTTGANRLISAWGCPLLIMASTVNASAAAAAIRDSEQDVVIIPAGLTSDPNFPAQEDSVAAVYIASKAGISIGEGHEQYRKWKDRIDNEGIEALFLSSLHAEKLRRRGLEKDISFCAQVDITGSVPIAVERCGVAVRCVDLAKRTSTGYPS